MPPKVIDLTTISKGELIQAIGDQRTTINQLREIIRHINTCALVFQDVVKFPFNPEARRALNKIVKLSGVFDLSPKLVVPGQQPAQPAPEKGTTV